jgi:WD40 repeat protein
VVSCAFSPDGRLALSASEDQTLRLWDVATGETLRTFEGHTDAVYGCAFSPDGRLALSASTDGTLRLWDAASGQTVRTFEGHTGAVYDCAFSPDGRLALSASGYPDDTLRLWDLASGQTVRTFEGHTSDVNSCTFSPDGRLALSASDDRTLRLWDVASGQQRIYWLTDAELECCACGPHGQQVLAGDRVGGVHFLELVGAEPAVVASPVVATGAASDAADNGKARATLESTSQAAATPKRGLFGWWRKR